MFYIMFQTVDGLLIIVDYTKAFDTIEWNFIEYCLNLFGFGDFITESVKLLQKNSFSRIEQNGQFSERTLLPRGRRQGDSSLHTFWLFVQRFSHMS